MEASVHPGGGSRAGRVVGVVVVHFGPAEPTTRCLASIRGDSSGHQRQIVVVDNHGNLEREELGADVRLVSCRDNPGFGAGANRGVAALDDGAEWAAFIILNNDVELQDGFVDAAVAALGPGIGAAGGPVTNGHADGELWYAGGEVRFLTGTVRQDCSDELARQRREVGFIPGAAIAVSPDAWRDVGGFDASYFLYNEDIDLCLRLRRRGWRLQYEPAMSCVHFLGTSTGSRSRSPLYLEQITRSRLRPFRPWLYRLYLSGLHSVYNALRILRLVAVHGGRAGPYVGAVFRGHSRALGEVLGLVTVDVPRTETD
jgi:N-acetylglucosaminyl-diphospho-decaprenol L-rhamnosyltransferase